MRSFFILAVALAAIAMPLQLSNAASKTAASGTLFGKVHDRGNGVRGITVEIMVGNCFSTEIRRRSTNAAGFYRFDGLDVNTLVYVGVNGFRAGQKNALYNAQCEPIQKASATYIPLSSARRRRRSLTLPEHMTHSAGKYTAQAATVAL